jgi:hypothetical protein
MHLKQYRIPAVAAALIFAALFAVGGLIVKHEQERVQTLETTYLAHGRALYVVVEEEGAYVGDEFVPFHLFNEFMKDHASVLRPDYAIVIGTKDARYGHVAEVFASIYGAVHVPGTIETRLAPVGTRRPAIAVHKNFWEY